MLESGSNQQTEPRKPVVLVQQSYNEARQSGSVGQMGLVGMVSATCPQFPLSRDPVKEINRLLQTEAENCGANYVFGVRFKDVQGYERVVGSGDAYRE